MINFENFYRATNPAKTLDIQKPDDQVYYIDFASVRGVEIIRQLKKKITVFNQDQPTCTLFTGHIGCGKSTELLKLRKELTDEGFHVVYFVSTEELETQDVELTDVLLVIARRIAQDLEDSLINLQPQGFKKFLLEAGRVLNTEVTGIKVKSPVGDVGVSVQEDKFSLSFAIGELTGKIKSDSTLHTRMTQYLAPKKEDLLKSINQELIEPAIAQLKKRGKKGLVVIVDNLDRIDNTTKPSGKNQQEYLFVDQAEYLRKFKCHLVYTMPLALVFSNSYGILNQRFTEDAKVLPMIPVKSRDNQVCSAGIDLLKQMVLARAFPRLEESARLENISEIFANEEILNRLCRVSGGHVRELLILLNNWIMEDSRLPLSEQGLNKVISSRRNAMTRAISDHEEELLKKVSATKRVQDEEGYEKLIRSLFVFEYQDEQGSWYDVNPILNIE